MSKTAVFKKTANPYEVAKEGYDAMIKGKLDVVAGLTSSQKVTMSMLKFMPKKLI